MVETFITLCCTACCCSAVALAIIGIALRSADKRTDEHPE